MAASSFSSLVDMLKQPPSNNSNLMESLVSQPTTIPHDDFHVTEMFGELYFKESSSSTLNSLFPPSSPAPPPSSSPLPNLIFILVTLKSLVTKPTLRRRKVLRSKMLKKMGAFTTRDHGKIRRETLKLAKSGNPFVYCRFDENSNRFIHEQIKILTQNILCTLRETSYLKLNFVHEDEEERKLHKKQMMKRRQVKEECGVLGLSLCVLDEKRESIGWICV